MAMRPGVSVTSRFLDIEKRQHQCLSLLFLVKAVLSTFLVQR